MSKLLKVEYSFYEFEQAEADLLKLEVDFVIAEIMAYVGVQRFSLFLSFL